MGLEDSEVKVNLDFDKIGEDVTDVLDSPTKRLETDLTSVFKLPHLIRPIAAIWAMAMFTVLSLLSLVLANGTDEMNTVTISLFASITTILTSIIGFYFNSRKQEKIQMKKAQAAIEIKEMELKAEIVRDKFEMREEKLDNKADRKAKKRPLFRRNKPK